MEAPVVTAAMPAMVVLDTARRPPGRTAALGAMVQLVAQVVWAAMVAPRPIRLARMAMAARVVRLVTPVPVALGAPVPRVMQLCRMAAMAVMVVIRVLWVRVAPVARKVPAVRVAPTAWLARVALRRPQVVTAAMVVQALITWLGMAVLEAMEVMEAC